MNRWKDVLWFVLLFVILTLCAAVVLTLWLYPGFATAARPVSYVLTRLFTGELRILRWTMAGTASLLICALVADHRYRLSGGGARVEDGAFGNARFATRRERTCLYPYVRYRKADQPGITLEIDKRGCQVDTSLKTVMLVCPPGGGKTKSLLIPTLLYNGIVNQNTGGKGASILSVDCKGEEYRTTKTFMQTHGYRTLRLDFREPRRSVCYNLLSAVNRHMDRATTTGADDRLYHRSLAEKQAKILAEAICAATELPHHSDNPFFTESAKGLITALILVVAEFGEPEERHIVSVFRLLLELNGMLQEETKASEPAPKSRLGTLLELLPGDVRAKLYAGAATSADVRTSMNVFSSALARLLAFMDAQTEQMVCGQSEELSVETFLEHPTCIYLILPDEDTTAHFFATLFIEQMTAELVYMASTERRQELPRQVLVLWDEFGQSPRCKGLVHWVGAWRSRGIRLLMALQDESQLELVYGREAAKVVSHVVQTRLYSHLPADETAQRLSKELGQYTVTTQSVTNGDHTGSSSQSTTGRPLLSHDEIAALPVGTWLVQVNGCHPIVAKLSTYDRVWPLAEEPDTGPLRPVRPIPYLTEQKLRERYVPITEQTAEPLTQLFREAEGKKNLRRREPMTYEKGEV